MFRQPLLPSVAFFVDNFNHIIDRTVLRWSTEKATEWTSGSGKRYTSGKNKTSWWTETSGSVNFHTSVIAYCVPQWHLWTVVPTKAAAVAETSSIIKLKVVCWWICITYHQRPSLLLYQRSETTCQKMCSYLHCCLCSDIASSWICLGPEYFMGQFYTVTGPCSFTSNEVKVIHYLYWNCWQKLMVVVWWYNAWVTENVNKLIVELCL